MSALVSETNETFHRDNLVCHLDTLTFVSPEHGEIETVVEVCEPYVAPEARECDEGPESLLFLSPEFGGEIEAAI